MSDKKQHAATVRDSLSGKIIGRILAFYMRLVYYTSRKRWTDAHHLTDALASGSPVIVVSWHNRNVLAAYAFSSVAPKHAKNLVPLISASRDGGMAASTMRSFGMKCIRGSSSRGGLAALKMLTSSVKNGLHVAITPDGPRGPKYSVQGGVVTTAKLTGAPIVPMTFQAKRKKRLGSWDQLIVPYPFGSLHFVYGAPIRVPRDTSAKQLTEYSESVRLELMRINEKSEQFNGL